MFNTITLILNGLVVLAGSLSLADLYPLQIDSSIIVLGFLGTIISGVLTIFKYKDRIAEIGKYIAKLDIMTDNMEITMKKVKYGGISDQQYYKELESIHSVITNSNSSTFNINSRDYYNYYENYLGKLLLLLQLL